MSFRTRFLLLGFIGLLATGCSSGSPKSNLSLEEASQLVIDLVIQPDQLDFNLIAFAWPELLKAGDVVAPYNYYGEDPAPSETTLEGETWFFWLDDLPGAHFTHENRFVFVDQATGEITTLDQEWWPTLNGKGLWLDEASYNNPDNWIYATVELQEDAKTFWNPPTGKMALAAFLSPPAQIGESPGHALVINVSTLDERGSDDFNTDVRLMTDALMGEGFKTTYLGPEGDTNPDRVGVPFSDSDRASGQPWRAWLRERALQVQPGETLVVYLTGHGDYDEGVSSVGGEKHRIFDFNLRQELSKFKPGVHIVVIVESCEAGGYTDALKDVADVTNTASDHDSAS